MKIIDITHSLVYTGDNKLLLSIHQLLIHTRFVMRLKLIQEVENDWHRFMYDGHTRGRLYAGVLTQLVKVADYTDDEDVLDNLE